MPEVFFRWFNRQISCEKVRNNVRIKICEYLAKRPFIKSQEIEVGNRQVGERTYQTWLPWERQVT